MATGPSRLDRLVKLVGEQNLPPKLNCVDEDDTVASHSADGHTNTTTSQPAVEFEGEVNTTKWWEPSADTRVAPAFAVQSQTSNSHHSAERAQSDGQKGKSSSLGVAFTPFLAVTKFPYKFVSDEWRQPLASAFFDEGKIWQREWDIYYIHCKHCPAAITFIPEHQLLALIGEINETFPGANISVTAELRNAGLVIDFDEFQGHPELRPRLLGRSTSRSQYDTWTSNLNMSEHGTDSSPDQRTLQAFKEKMQQAIDMGKNKNKAARARRQAESVVKRQGMAKSLLRAQQYLGFVPSQEDLALRDLSTLSISAQSDPGAPTCHPFHMDVVFIAFDVEAYERPPRPVTEIGVATLDTRDLQRTAPGSSGEKWQQFIHARHFLIEEYKHYKNHEFVQGCPDKFEFGKSEIISKNSIGKNLSACFKPPFGGTIRGPFEEKRNIVLLGHDISQDINYLQSIGFNVLNNGQICDSLDTAEMYRVYSRDPNARSLGSIIYDFDFMGWNLHNAGNDAVYTIWAFLAICARKAGEAGSADEAQKHKADLETRTEIAIEQAKQKIKDDHEGWEVPH